MNRSAHIIKSMRNAEASVNMENLYISDENKELCYKLLNQEISFEEYLTMIKNKVMRV